MSELWFTKDHEWVRVDNGEGTVGVSDYAQKQLGDMVFIDLPAIGVTFAQGDTAAVAESVKAASEVYAPVSGVVEAINADLNNTPSMVNEDPYGQGWFFRMHLTSPSDLTSLMDETAYEAYINELG
ncbi:MAG: glycine cleavage system protein GcvH [Alphaproteobacteria bacterium]|nr:glycine cleavage system protein GcvH [Alphaproteobacteria bacterium]